MRLIAYVLFLLTFISCNDGEKLLNYEEVDTATSDILYDIEIDNSGHITIAGGYVWSHGFMIETDQNLQNLEKDTISNKALFYMLRTNGDQFVTVGTDGYIFFRESRSRPWAFYRTSEWGILHHIIKTKNGYLASGGKSYGTGYIHHLNADFQIDTTLHFKHEISEVKAIKDEKLISVGWGNIQRSDDNGMTWRTLPNEGDFYASIIFTSAQHGIIIGYNGTLLESNDGGDTWQNSSADISNNGFSSFRKLVQIENGPIFITGNQGKLWKSDDNGTTWQYYLLNTTSDIYDIARCPDGDYIAVGSNGFLAKFAF